MEEGQMGRSFHFEKCLLSTYDIPATLTGVEESRMKKIKSLFRESLLFWGKGRNISKPCHQHGAGAVMAVRGVFVGAEVLSSIWEKSGGK